jgi:hypothetical protein
MNYFCTHASAAPLNYSFNARAVEALVNTTPKVDQFVVDSIVANVAFEVEQRLSQKQDFYWGIAAGVGTVLIGFFGFLGLGQISGMRKQIRDGLFAEVKESVISDLGLRASMEASIGGALEARIGAQLTQVTQQVALSRLSFLSAKVDSGTGFSDYEKNALIEGLFVLKDSQAITSSNEFRESLGNVVRSFQGADLDAELDRVHDTLGPELLEADFKTAVNFMLNYAERVLGSGNPANFEVERFLRYASALKRLNQYEDALPYLLTASVTMPDKVKAFSFKDLKLDFDHLKRLDEKEKCARILFNYAENENPPPTARMERMRDKFRTFVGMHGSAFEAWKAKNEAKTEQ